MLTTLLSFIVVLGVVVFVHELGHFLAAKMVGARVEAFSIGFGKLVGVKWGETEYRLGYIPLGGYVKIAGMVDEFLEEDGGISGAPDEFQSKSTLAKVFMITAGVIMNFLLGILLYGAVTFFEGEPVADESATLGRIVKEYPAHEAGMLPGDRIIVADGQMVDSWIDFRDIIHAHPGEEVTLRYVREADTLSTTLTPKAEEITDTEGTRTVGLIGVGQQVRYVERGLIRSLVVGVETTGQIIGLSLKSIWMLITGQASVQDLTGPAGILYLSGETARAGWVSFVSFIGLISVSIGLLNILPFPVLDGGHLVYILIEAVLGRSISPRIKLTLQQVGLALILVLFVIVTYHDIVRFFVG